MLGSIDSMTGGHCMMKLQCGVIQRFIALPWFLFEVKKNDALVLPTTVRVSGQHSLVYLAYAKLFSLNLVLAAS
jgi:hypothetical protein